nr:immunoglobulin heavy chain junction region [Macaca mulatta]MOV53454.1 immunoglobulin heavy chain junction region [Macaca mulatta]MOV53643.1 immunoglobulin heavy chain junction region [Macaca mulatta]MOV53829.1 immunoglobulin heavy chain junction region [Macaca mulatta]MOV54059.1 immunoglobulin heavy chain junction region [Macaca mulatta]
CTSLGWNKDHFNVW